MNKKNWRISAAFVSLLVGGNTAAMAFEDADCSKQQVVPIAVEEPLKNALDADAARDRALKRAGQLAISQVSGFRLHSERASTEEADNDQVRQRYEGLERSILDGWIRVKIVQEDRRTLGDGASVALQTQVTVCDPKPEAVRKAARDAAERAGRPPAPVDPVQANWFDPVTGEARLWYYKAKDGTYEFFDNQGFHPKTGEKLTAVTRPVYTDWKVSAEKARQLEADRRAAEQKEAADRAQRDAAARQAEQDRAARIAQAADLCDQLAGNPNDPRRSRSVSGAPWDALKSNAANAIDSCTIAVQRNPSEPRYRYQLGRAISVTDPNRARTFFERLMGENYPAAFDNFGWTLLDTRSTRRDLDGAITAFRRGASLGDSDAMTSLSVMIQKGRAAPQFYGEDLALLRKAAALGNADAASALSALEDANRQSDLQRQQQEQAARAFMGIVGGAFGAMPRR